MTLFPPNTGVVNHFEAESWLQKREYLWFVLNYLSQNRFIVWLHYIVLLLESHLLCFDRLAILLRQFLTSWETQNVIIWRDWNETEKSTFLKIRSFDANETHWLASYFCFLYQQHYLLSSTAVSCGESLLLIVYLIKTNVHGTTS